MDELRPQEPLQNLFDLKPERLHPAFYAVTIDVPVNQNGVGQGSITIRNQPLIITRIATRILGLTWDPETTGLADDGQYLVEWSDEQRNYTPAPVNADLLFGPKHQGSFQSLVYPLYYAGTHTILFRLTNLYQRVLTPEVDTYQVQVLMQGLADFGMEKVPR